MEKPILEQYETQIDVDCFVLTNNDIDRFENDEYKYQKQQETIKDCKHDFRITLDSVVEKYKGQLHNFTIRDILEEVSDIVYGEL